MYVYIVPKNNSKKNRNSRNRGKSLKAPGVMFTGHGDYKAEMINAVKSATKGALATLGSSLGRKLGGQIGMGDRGSRVGTALANKLSRFIGSGDYAVSDTPQTNSLFVGSKPLENGSFSPQDVVFSHREYIGDISGAGPGTTNFQTYQINPGLDATFPFLSSMAQNYEEYEFMGLIFEYVPLISPYSTANYMGKIVMTMSYNPAAPPFSSVTQLENSAYAISTRPDKGLVYGVECAKFSQNSFFTRYGTASPITAYDIGLLQLAIAGVPTTGIQGELWVTYNVRLKTPRVTPFNYGYYHSIYNGTGTSMPLSGLYSLTSQGSLTGVTVTQNGTEYTFTTGPLPARTVCRFDIIWNNSDSTDPVITTGGGVVPGANASAYLAYGNIATTNFAPFTREYSFCPTGVGSGYSKTPCYTYWFYNSAATTAPVSVIYQRANITKTAGAATTGPIFYDFQMICMGTVLTIPPARDTN